MNPNRTATRRLAPVSLVGGLAMMAIALAAVAKRLDVSINMALAAGCGLVLAGVAWMATAIVRARRSSAGSSEPFA